MEWLKSDVNGSVSSLFNQSEVAGDTFDFYNVNRVREDEQFVVYKVVAYIFGTIIFLSNLTVVISSGLILKKGQKLKSTYLILGNVSLADTIIGISIIFGVTIENLMSSSTLCIFQIGMLVCPAMVSIFSVGLIAVDRYIYIVHGLYYQRWFNTTKVRIGILCIWVIVTFISTIDTYVSKNKTTTKSIRALENYTCRVYYKLYSITFLSLEIPVIFCNGITLAFLPATGWVNTELRNYRCYYVSLFPGALILLNSLLSIVPIVLVAILYSIILVKALKNVREIKASIKIVNKTNKPEMRIYRGNGGNIKNTVQSVKLSSDKLILRENKKLKRSASFNGNSINDLGNSKFNKLCYKSKSNNSLNNDKSSAYKNSGILTNSISQNTCESKISVYSITSSVPEDDTYKKRNSRNIDIEKRKRKNVKVKEPNKWRAIIVVMLTSGSFIFTWMPFFITVMFYVFCQEKLSNSKCLQLRMMLSGPIATLAFLNSILNPLIYAWWNKGFQKSIKMYFRKYFYAFFQKDVLR